MNWSKDASAELTAALAMAALGALPSTMVRCGTPTEIRHRTAETVGTHPKRVRELDKRLGWSGLEIASGGKAAN